MFHRLQSRPDPDPMAVVARRCRPSSQALWLSPYLPAFGYVKYDIAFPNGVDLMNKRGIVILTGAGISRESGLATFRDADGIWAKVRIENVATPEAFARDPPHVQAFYDARRVQLRDPAIQPNAAHNALARLARDYPGPVLVVTQNVDDLHDRAGQHPLLHMHGELLKARCLGCGAVSPFEGAGLAAASCPACNAQALRPHVVWFGEVPLHMEEVEDALAARCGLFAAIGTSGQVYPAAGFAEMARVHGASTVELNLEPTGLTRAFEEARHGPATEVVPAWVDEVLVAAHHRG